MYAVVNTGGKQVKVEQGDVVRVEKIDGPVGETVELTRVCLVAKDDGLVVDPAGLQAAKVVCDIVAHGREKKIRVFKKRRRKNSQRLRGHRQAYTELRVREIAV